MGRIHFKENFAICKMVFLEKYIIFNCKKIVLRGIYQEMGF